MGLCGSKLSAKEEPRAQKDTLNQSWYDDAEFARFPGSRESSVRVEEEANPEPHDEVPTLRGSALQRSFDALEACVGSDWGRPSTSSSRHMSAELGAELAQLGAHLAKEEANATKRAAIAAARFEAAAKLQARQRTRRSRALSEVSSPRRLLTRNSSMRSTAPADSRRLAMRTLEMLRADREDLISRKRGNACRKLILIDVPPPWLQPHTACARARV